MSELCFECTQCGDCCRVRDGYAHVYLNEEEQQRLADHLKIPIAEFLWRYTVLDELGWTELQFREKHCPFLDSDSNRCTVHEARPLQCRTFPFWRGFVEEGGWSDEVRSMCEGIDRGRAWSRQEAEELMVRQEEADRADTDDDPDL